MTLQKTEAVLSLKGKCKPVVGAADAAIAGLDFFVRNQCKNDLSADNGRFPIEYDCLQNQVVALTGNWTTAIAIEAFLAGYRFTGNKSYIEAAGNAIGYLKTLQEFSPMYPRLRGAFREETPQTSYAMPRDSLTAAWAMLDWSQETGDDTARQRAEMFADWFIEVAMEKGYPYWRVIFDSEEWTPMWTGSFQSGGAFFFYRLFMVTGKDKYRKAMRQILDYYNRHHIDENGKITVIRDRQTFEPLDGKADLIHSNRRWEVMHQYNDDFGALANLAAYKLEKDSIYLNSAKRFLSLMSDTQRSDGGFGPDSYSIPSAAGSVLTELLAARQLGFDWIKSETIDGALEYILNLQIHASGNDSDGAFCSLDGENEVCGKSSNIRTAAYSIQALLRCAGAQDPYYFFE